MFFDTFRLEISINILNLLNMQVTSEYFAYDNSAQGRLKLAFLFR